ncbi:MAG: hypothetical protein QOG32_289, partial [Chloroflexota bacterium]|nr:hypothetical protein [Chloroflexota bacterium]
MGTSHSARHQGRRGFATVLASILVMATQVFVVMPTVSAAVPTNDIKLSVISARTEPRALPTAVTKGDLVTTYKWLINEDNTGTTTQRTPSDGCSPASAGYPDSCKWTSIAGLKSSAPVAAQGDNSTLNATTALTGLADGKYLLSVYADGYKLDGMPFTLPLTDTTNTLVLPVQPLPLPTATLMTQVFQDTESTNGQYDPGENGLAGFQGFITDYLGQVTTDVFGNPLCTTYVMDPANPTQVLLDSSNSPTVDVMGGKCLSGAD